MAIEYHSGERGNPGVTVSITGSDGVVRRTVIPAFILTDAAGNPLNGSTFGAWTTGATAQDLRYISSGELQVYGLSGGDTIAVTRSIDGTHYVAQSLTSNTLTVVATISADGIYAFPGGGYLKWTQTGSASTPTITLRAGG
jgi:hypothetical protein